MGSDTSKTTDNGSADSFLYQTLSKIPDLPGIPKWTGQMRLIHGIYYPNAPGGTSVTLVVGVPQDGSTACNWYQDALRLARWNVTPASGRYPGVRATLSGYFVDIRAGTPMAPGDGCQLTIQYRTTKGTVEQ